MFQILDWNSGIVEGLHRWIAGDSVFKAMNLMAHGQLAKPIVSGW
jgi:hypothetical protein